MWIEISDDLIEAYPTQTLEVVAAIEAICRASYCGHHVLAGSIAALKWAAKLSLSATALAALRQAVSKFSMLGALREQIQWRVHITNGTEIERTEFGWNLPVGRLATMNLQVSKILAENIRDAEALMLAGRHYKKHHRLNGINLVAHPTMGGGAEIVSTLSANIEAEAFVFSVTDSDKVCPQSPSSAVTRACQQIITRSGWVCEHLELPAREIENILPLRLVEDSVFRSPELADLFGRMSTVCALAERFPEALLYLDLKLGTRAFNALGGLDNAEKCFWNAVLERANCRERVFCEFCPQQAENECTCYLIGGLGERMLQRFLDYCNLQSVDKQVEVVYTSPHSDAWFQLGKLALSWGVATERMRL